MKDIPLHSVPLVFVLGHPMLKRSMIFETTFFQDGFGSGIFPSNAFYPFNVSAEDVLLESWEVAQIVGGGN